MEGITYSHGLKFKNKLYLPDSTPIELTLSLFPWAAVYRRRKREIKLHTLIDTEGGKLFFFAKKMNSLYNVKRLVIFLTFSRRCKMKCFNCGAELKEGQSFCSNCGEKVINNEKVSMKEITLDWILSILRGLGYTREKDKEGENEIFVTHKTMHNMAFKIRQDLGLILVNSFFLMKKAGWGGKTEQYIAINKANGMCNVSTWFYTENNNLIGAYTFIPLSENIEKQTIIALVNLFNKDIVNSLSKSGIMNYMD
jgi:predicted nucleic acid-binding Zn ribbon protein